MPSALEIAGFIMTAVVVVLNSTLAAHLYFQSVGKAWSEVWEAHVRLYKMLAFVKQLRRLMLAESGSSCGSSNSKLEHHQIEVHHCVLQFCYGMLKLFPGSLPFTLRIHGQKDIVITHAVDVLDPSFLPKYEFVEAVAEHITTIVREKTPKTWHQSPFFLMRSFGWVGAKEELIKSLDDGEREVETIQRYILLDTWHSIKLLNQQFHIPSASSNS